MTRRHILLLFVMLSVLTLQAQFAKPLKNPNLICLNTSPFSLGFTGSFAANDMIYSAVSTSEFRPMFGPTFGLAAEWNAMPWFSVGLDASYAMRGAKKAFATEFLTSYSTTTFARMNYSMALNGIELRLPLTLYVGYGETTRLYLYVAPRFNLWTYGNIRWERSYDDDSFPPLVYESEVNKATIKPFDISAVAGLGLRQRVMIGRAQFFVKLDLSYGFSPMNNFSENEVITATGSSQHPLQFQGWGDIEHEKLGTRRLHNAEIRLSLLAPLRKHLKDACAFEQNMKKHK